MGQESNNALQYGKRLRSNYNESPSLVLRVVELDDNGNVTIINPFLPIAKIAYDNPDSPLSGITGPDTSNIKPLTDNSEGGDFLLFGIDYTRISDFPTLILFYQMLKQHFPEGDMLNTAQGNYSNDAGRVQQRLFQFAIDLAEILPDEVFFPPQQAATDPGVYRLIILEKR